MNDLKQNAATEIVNKLTEHGIIKRMCSPWASSLVWVSKARRALTKEEAVAQGKPYIPFQTNQSAGHHYDVINKRVHLDSDCHYVKM